MFGRRPRRDHRPPGPPRTRGCAAGAEVPRVQRGIARVFRAFCERMLRRLAFLAATSLCTVTALAAPPCVGDITPDAGVSVASIDDLDGDGVNDVVASDEFSGTASWRQTIYFSNRGCRRQAATLFAGELHALPTHTNAIRDLETRVSNGCAGGDFAWTRLGWNGQTYVVTDQATCSYCYLLTDAAPPAPGANGHPYCRKARASFP